MREIGSEFPKMPFENGEGFNLISRGAMVFSGRTAIETVLKQIPYARRALLPSYCCESMIVPFSKAGVEVSFYHVFYDGQFKIDLNISSDIDILLWCNYFGYKNDMPDLSYFSKRGGIIIEDVTHSILSTKQYHEQSDYLVASLRKWEPVYCGGYCVSMKDELQHLPNDIPSESFIVKKEKAMKLKKQYLCDHDEEKKNEFLRLFWESNSWLANNYSGLSIDSWSRQYLSTIDIEKQRQIRRYNASILYKGLRDKVQFLFSEEQIDCPLFVPILLANNRSKIRAELIANSVYCPIHWPMPKGCESNLYDIELSLICDQRYAEEDMNRIVSVLRQLL